MRAVHQQEAPFNGRFRGPLLLLFELAGPVVSVTFLDGKGSPRFLFRAWSSLATAPGVMTGGRFFSKTPKHE